MDNLKVLIIGAGPCGLAIAQGLKKIGIPHEIFDRETGPRDRNWGVTIGWSVEHLQKILPQDLVNALPRCRPNPHEQGVEELWMRNGQTGALMVVLPVPGVQRLNMHKMKKVFAENLDVQYGKKFSSLTINDEKSVTAHFEDGSTSTGSVLIGVEGGRSLVRQFLLSPEDARNEDLPFAFMNIAVSYTAEQALWLKNAINPHVDCGVHPNGMFIGLFFLDMPVPSHPESWKFYVLASWPKVTKEDHENPPGRLQRLKARMTDWGEPYKSAIEWIPDDTPVPEDYLRCWIPKPWDDHGGKVTLGGDAAHLINHYRGQGCNNAFRDSERFVTALSAVHHGEKSLADAIAEYEAEVLERGGKEVVTSRQQTFSTHDFQSFLDSPLAKSGVGPTGKLKDDKYNAKLTTQLEQGVKVDERGR